MKTMMRKKITVKALVLGIGIAGMCMIPTAAMGKAAGPCVNCHTMHNSQNGVNVLGTDTPNGALVTGGCVGCHTSSGAANVENFIPMVMHTTAPAGTKNGDTLAGGSFYWVDAGDDTKGHNILGMGGGVDDLIEPDNTPPGWNATFNANTQVGSTWATNQLTCAGTYGCHGDHTQGDDFSAVSGAHHADDSAIDGSTVAKSFRFLLGIKGIEDADWEDNPGVSHNQYYAVDRTTDDATTAAGNNNSINYLCAECHGDFHSGAGDLGTDADASFGAAWLRHPTDIDMADYAGTTEYASYTTYDPLAPVGSISATAVADNAVRTDGNGIVLCISCHRAHGSEYADLLRWDYGTCSAAGTNDESECGCFVCHTTK